MQINATAVHSSISCSQSTPAASPWTPSPEYICNRVHSTANYKLRLEASRNEPRLGKLLGHIFVYDAIREYKQSQAQQSLYTSSPAARRREQQLRRRQMSEASRLSQNLTAVTEEDSDSTPASPDNAADIKEYLSQATVPPTIPQSHSYDIASFQQAIAYQLATLSQVRLEAASRQLYHMTQDDDDADEVAVEEYESDHDDSDDSSDYDSYDGDDDWRADDLVFDRDEDRDDDDHHDSDTDPESVNSEPPSPITEEPMLAGEGEGKAPQLHMQTQLTGGCYFLPLRPLPPSRRTGSASPATGGEGRSLFAALSELS